MALSLLSQQPSFLDLQLLLDHFPTLHQPQQRITTSAQTTTAASSYQMEYNTQNHYQPQQQQSGNTTNSNNNPLSNSNNDSANNNNNNNNKNSNTTTNNNGVIQSQNGKFNNSNNNNNNSLHNTNSGDLQQARNFISGYHHQHIGADYEQIINFVDSPPNSEESWTDEHSKGSPGPQIIEVQTIFGESGSRKRRMDWDSLDIGQNENAAPAQNPVELPTKLAHGDKDKLKREKLSVRGSWTDEIGFDLNAEFHSNSYLNNETFLFSPTLTALKQEPQTDQLKVNKNLLGTTAENVSKVINNKSAINGDVGANSPQIRTKNSLANNICGCSSPKSNSQQSFEQNTLVDKSANNDNGPHHSNKNSVRSGSGIQPLTIVETAKIESASNVVTTSQADDHKFQYILAAATSIATKNNEETLTYLNQGQSYEIKLKKIGDLSFYRDKILKSVIKICFHERRLQFMEREQMHQWQQSRPGERIIEVDVPLSYGLCNVSQPLNPNYLNTVEVFWDPLKEVGVYIKVNCISTEFTPKKHGGEKGVPFRLQIETYIENTNIPAVTNASGTTALQSSVANTSSSPSATPGNSTPNPSSNTSTVNNLVGSKQPVHAAACQIKVFKLKGADRKHKQDREKIQKRPQSEQEKFQPSYECTIMNEISLDIITQSGCFSPEYMKIWPNSPVHIPKYDGILPYTGASTAANANPIAINSVTSTNSPTLKLMDANMVSPQHVAADVDDYAVNIMPESTPAQVSQWLANHRLTAYKSTFTHFSGSDVMRMSKDDLIQICGLADGIRMYNILRAKAITPRLTIYVSIDGSSYNAIYLISGTSKELTQKLFHLPGFYELIANAPNASLENGPVFNNWNMHSKYSGSGSNIFNDVNKSLIYMSGPSGVHVTVTDEVLNNEIKDGSLYALEVQNGKVVMKLINKNDN